MRLALEQKNSDQSLTGTPDVDEKLRELNRKKWWAVRQERSYFERCAVACRELTSSKPRHVTRIGLWYQNTFSLLHLLLFVLAIFLSVNPVKYSWIQGWNDILYFNRETYTTTTMKSNDNILILQIFYGIVVCEVLCAMEYLVRVM